MRHGAWADKLEQEDGCHIGNRFPLLTLSHDFHGVLVMSSPGPEYLKQGSWCYIHTLQASSGQNSIACRYMSPDISFLETNYKTYMCKKEY